MNEIFANFPRLAERQHQLAGLLSGGEQQLLALNRALLSQPRLLILDEPSMGLAPLMVENIFRVIATLRQRGVALLLIEQNARLALEATDSAWVMDSGSIVERGRRRRCWPTTDCTDLFGRNARLTHQPASGKNNENSKNQCAQRRYSAQWFCLIRRMVRGQRNRDYRPGGPAHRPFRPYRQGSGKRRAAGD
jgi:ABC-type glutathione transport system ATPase component